MISTCRLAPLVVLALLVSGSPAVSRNALQDMWGVVTDPLKLEKSSAELSRSLERILGQLELLEGRTNYDMQQRLEQIRSIVHDALDGTQAIVADATKRMIALEGQINADAVKLIYRAQCAAEVVLMDQLQRSFAQLIGNLKKADPGINILGVRTMSLDISDIRIDYPDQAYVSTKTAVLSSLKKSVNDSSKAYDILSAYQNLERAASFVRCYYIDQALEIRWVQEVAELERLSLPWVLIVQPTM